MNYKPMEAVQFAAYVKSLERNHGRDALLVATKSEHVRMITALFDETRPKGRRFQLFIDTEEMAKRPKRPTGLTCVQIWEDANYGTPTRKAPNEFWKGYSKSLPKDSTPEDVGAVMIEAFEQAHDWALKE